MTMKYNGGKGTMSPQLKEYHWNRKAILTIAPEQYFSQMGSTTKLPKNSGEKIKKYVYIPLLDPRNINDQGIDGEGNSVVNSVTIQLTSPEGAHKYFKGTGTNAVTGLADAKDKVAAWLRNNDSLDTDYATTIAAMIALGWKVTEHDAVPSVGNLYAGDRDIATVTSMMPNLMETATNEWRVGWKRDTREGTITHLGLNWRYTNDMIDFDSDDELLSHLYRETLIAANTINEDYIMKNLIANAGTVMYGGGMLGTQDLDNTCQLTYSLIKKAERILDENRCPKNTKIVKGSNLTDTKVVGAARYAYIGSSLKPTLEAMKDYHGNPAFVPVEHYAAATNIAHGEIGKVGNVRFIEVPMMLQWTGGGAATPESCFLGTVANYDVFPVLFVGDESFSQIDFRGSGSNNPNNGKYRISHTKPGGDINETNMYANKGFYSIQWWAGMLIERPERILLMKVTAPQLSSEELTCD